MGAAVAREDRLWPKQTGGLVTTCFSACIHSTAASRSWSLTNYSGHGQGCRPLISGTCKGMSTDFTPVINRNLHLFTEVMARRAVPSPASGEDRVQGAAVGGARGKMEGTAFSRMGKHLMLSSQQRPAAYVRRCSQNKRTHGQASHMACGRGGLQSMPPLLPLLMAIEWRLLRYPRMRAASTTFWRLAWRARRLKTANEYKTGSVCDGLKTLACVYLSNAKLLGNKLASLALFRSESLSLSCDPSHVP